MKYNYIGIPKNDFLKIFACLFMLLDHLGFILDNIFLRIIGRLSFPLFAFLLVVGNSRTRCKYKYFFRLLIFGIISQIPYTLLFNSNNLNVFFTLALGLILINLKFDYNFRSIIINLLFISFVLLLQIYFPFDYGLYGLFVIYVFKFCNIQFYNFLLFSLITLFYSLFFGFYIQIFSILALPVIYYYSKSNSYLILNKYFYYIFYPVHLLIIYYLDLNL